MTVSRRRERCEQRGFMARKVRRPLTHRDLGHVDALSARDENDIRIEHDIVPAVCGEGQIRVKPAFVGICGTVSVFEVLLSLGRKGGSRAKEDGTRGRKFADTCVFEDLHEFITGPKYVHMTPLLTGLKINHLELTKRLRRFSPTSPHPVTKEQVPLTIGHEFSGIVVEIGPKIPAAYAHLAIGQHVAVQPTIYCGHCGACKNDAENACAQGGFIGLSGGGGGMSENVVVPAEACFPLPANIDLDVGSLVEPLAVAWHAVDASGIESIAEPSCVVLGMGPIGLAVLQVLKARGAKRVICLEVAARRQQFATDFDADHVLDPTKVDVVSRCLELNGGVNGPDLAFDCAGVAASLETACKVIKSRGTIVNVAIWEQAVPFNPNWLVFREANYKAVLGYQRKDFEGVIEALAKGKITPQRMITDRIDMTRIVEDGYLALIHRKEENVKILVDVKRGMPAA
nr:(r,r)-butanediol dehydrogenase [Quercus suber]